MFSKYKQCDRFCSQYYGATKCLCQGDLHTFYVTVTSLSIVKRQFGFAFVTMVWDIYWILEGTSLNIIFIALHQSYIWNSTSLPYMLLTRKHATSNGVIVFINHWIFHVNIKSNCKHVVGIIMEEIIIFINWCQIVQRSVDFHLCSNKYHTICGQCEL